ncbi:MAG: TlpA family protein disulfide reductase [Jejuia sp.]
MYLKLKLRSLVLLVILWSLPNLFFGQIKISENIQDSQLTTTNENKLYFVDFWATWCGPCIHASKYLTSLQRQYPNGFHIMSLSQENPDIVKRFMKKHNLELAVAIDYKGETFSKYNIASLPYGILFNAKGEKLWEGHPADFKTYHLDGYLSTNKKTLSVGKMYKLQSLNPVQTAKVVGMNTDFDIVKLEDNTTTFIIDKKSDYLELSGNLKDILAYTNNVFHKQITLPSLLQKSYKVRFKYDSDAYENKTQVILNSLELQQKAENKKGEVLFFNITSPRFWDVNQIDWGNDSPNFLIGDSDIKADNVSLNQVNYQLTNLLDIPIITNNDTLANELHDWDIHYKYFDLMISSFSDTYGIKVEKRVSEYHNYIITKKTP